MQMMTLLTMEAAEFQERLDNARHILQNHWDSLGFKGLTPPDPAAYKVPEQPAAPKEPKNETRYQLTVVEDAEVKDPANITRAEFQELKRHLASMRKRKTGKGKKAA